MGCDKVVQSVSFKQLSRLCVCSVGSEARRFNRTVPCGKADGGNEADGGTSEDGRVKQVMDRFSGLGGGVGGVEIHVGGEDLVKSELNCEEPLDDKG